MSNERARGAAWRVNLLLSLSSLVLTLALLGAAEFALRLAGVGEPDASRTSRLKYQQIYLPVLVEGQRADGTRILHPADKRLPYQSIRSHKTPGSIRIFAFGESATAGLGYSPNVTYTRDLERMLQAAYPGVTFEVVNLGIVALGSKQVRLLVGDVCARYDPDILIIYSGNNEFLELHAEKYSRAHVSVLARLADRVRETNTYRLVDRVVSGPPKIPSTADQDASNDALRVPESELIEDIQVSPAEIGDVVDRYEANIEGMVDSARASRTHIILMTVASNWKWRGRKDLPSDWPRELLGGDAGDDADTWRRVRAATSARLDAVPARERHEWLFRRAVAAEAAGDFASARDDYVAAMNQDPHLRRALSAANDRVVRIAGRRDVPLVDTVETLSRQSTHGIIGFDEFYDYVHFTPRGAWLVAEALFEAIARQGWIQGTPRIEPRTYVASEIERVEALHEDPLAVQDWMGFCFDEQLIHDRDLWKYERMAAALDARIEKDRSDVRALVCRANVHYFELDGAAAAERDYEAALAIAPERVEIRGNLERLRAEGRR